jgi:hypothetical protein
LKQLEPELAKIEKYSDVKKIQAKLLDLAIEYPMRCVVDDLTGLQAIKSRFFTDSAKAKFAFKLLKSLRIALKNVNLNEGATIRRSTSGQSISSAADALLAGVGAGASNTSLVSMASGSASEPAKKAEAVGGGETATTLRLTGNISGNFVSTELGVNPDMAQFATYIFVFVHEIWKLWPTECDGKNIKLMQEVLFFFGFPRAAGKLKPVQYVIPSIL